MAKPPPDVDPEKFIIGRGGYSNLQTARPFFDERVFRIDPAPTPVRMIVMMNLLFAAVLYGFHALLKYVYERQIGTWHVNEQFTPWVIYGVPLGMGLLICCIFTVAACYSFAKDLRLGTWLTYDKVSGQVDLPRDNVRFERKEIVHLQYITTRRLRLGRLANNPSLSELNLIMCRDGIRRRWPLLRSIASIRAFHRILNILLEETDLPVTRVVCESLSWKVTETSYRGK